MQAAQLYQYIHDPLALKKASVKELEALVKAFPYFQAAHMMLSLAAATQDDGVYQKTLKRTAIAAPSRSHLFRLHRNIITPELIVEQPAEVTAPKQEQVAQQLTPEASQDEIVESAVTEVPREEPPVVLKVEDDKEEEAQALEKLALAIESNVVASAVESEIIRYEPPVTKEPEKPESFGDWLAYLKKNNGQPYEEIEKEVKKEKEKEREKERGRGKEAKRKKNMDILDKIIEINPGPIRQREEKFFAPDLKAKESLLENEHLVTETLAKIYALQGNTGKAIRAYEILSLKFPQKSAYFAALIQQLRQNE